MLKLFEFEWIRIIISNFFMKKKIQIELILDDEQESELKFSKCK